jgi:ATP-binding cassette subfamily B protein
MFAIKKTLALSETGWRDFKRAVFACVLTNLCLFLPFIVITQAIVVLLDPLMSGGTLDTQKLLLLLAGGCAAALLYFFVYRNEYRKTLPPRTTSPRRSALRRPNISAGCP